MSQDIRRFFGTPGSGISITKMIAKTPEKRVNGKITNGHSSEKRTRKAVQLVLSDESDMEDPMPMSMKPKQQKMDKVNGTTQQQKKTEPKAVASNGQVGQKRKAGPVIISSDESDVEETMAPIMQPLKKRRSDHFDNGLLMDAEPAKLTTVKPRQSPRKEPAKIESKLSMKKVEPNQRQAKKDAMRYKLFCFCRLVFVCTFACNVLVAWHR